MSSFPAHTLQHTVTLCNTLQHTATLCNTLHNPSYIPHCLQMMLQHTAILCNTPQLTATRCNAPQHAVTRCNALQHTATHCNALQHNPWRIPHCLSSLYASMLSSHIESREVVETAVHYNKLQHTATHCTALQNTKHTARFHSLPPSRALQNSGKVLHTLQNTATHCHSLQHAATHYEETFATHSLISPQHTIPFVVGRAHQDRQIS